MQGERRGLILISVPSPDNWSYQKPQCGENYARENDVTYLDLNLSVEELGIDWTADTTDRGDHLSFTGAKKVTDYLGDYLSENFRLKDRRSEPVRRMESFGEKLSQAYEADGAAGGGREDDSKRWNRTVLCALRDRS